MSYLKLIIYSLTPFIILGCGASKVAKDVGSSREELVERVNTDGAYVAQCNGFSENSMAGLLTSFVVPGSGTYDYTKINLRMVQLPREVFTSRTFKIEMYLWKQLSNDETVIREDSVDFYIQNRYTGQFIMNSQGAVRKFSSLSLGYIREIVDSYEDPDRYNLDTFLKKHNFLLTGVSLEYEALVMALYPIDGGDAIKYVNFLLPPFYSNPNIFEGTHPSPIMYKLHPFINESIGSYTEQDYYNLSEAFCADFMREDSALLSKSETLNSVNSDLSSETLDRKVASIQKGQKNQKPHKKKLTFWNQIQNIFRSMGRFLDNLFSLKVFPVPVSPHK